MQPHVFWQQDHQHIPELAVQLKGSIRKVGPTVGWLVPRYVSLVSRNGLALPIPAPAQDNRMAANDILNPQFGAVKKWPCFSPLFLVRDNENTNSAKSAVFAEFVNWELHV